MAENCSKRDTKFFNGYRAFMQNIVGSFLYGNIYKFYCNLRVVGRENLPAKDEFYIVASNHLSAVDPFLMQYAIKRPLAYMAKKELFEGFWQRLFMNMMGAFEVNREKLQVSTIKTALGLKKTKWLLGIFPQGTRKADDDMSSVSRGFVVLAKSLKCAILPVGIIGANKKDRHDKNTKMYYHIGKPIPYTEDTEKMGDAWLNSIKELTNLENLEAKLNE